MKKLKINFMMVFALAIGVITMSFKLVEKATETSVNWFAVESDGSINSTPMIPGPDCTSLPSEEYCAVGFTSASPPVSNIGDTTLEEGAQPVDGVLYREE